MKRKSGSYLFILMLTLAACGPKHTADKNVKDSLAVAHKSEPAVTAVPFGKMKDGKEVLLYTLKNKRGTTLTVMNYGGIITSLKTADKNGVVEDVVLGFDSLAAYERESPYFGALIGRYGNRIAKGKFTLEGKQYKLATNDGANHLHGGKKGFDKVFWDIEVSNDTTAPSVDLHYISNDGEEGYPGTLTARVTYTLTQDNELKIKYSATTDKATVLNLTQHTYFNLTGNTKRDILEHEVVLEADRFLPVDKGLIPTGELKPVAKTPFDFRNATAIGKRIDVKDDQLTAGIGYDHCWVLTNKTDGMKNAGTVYDPSSGREIQFSTTEPAVQFYSGNFLDGKLTGKYGVAYKHRFGLCLETQHYPDSPNQKSFPSVVLEPGKTYTSETIYKFSVRR